jgi:hypothetical protein
LVVDTVRPVGKAYELLQRLIALSSHELLEVSTYAGLQPTNILIDGLFLGHGRYLHLQVEEPLGEVLDRPELSES